MTILTIGLNHNTAPVEIRERLAFAPEKLESALGEVKSVNALDEVAIISTCNRTELYCYGEEDAARDIVQWLREFHQLKNTNLDAHLYQLRDQSAVQHILRVASGLDSLVLGEPQILGQMKNAYRQAQKAGTLGSVLSHLFQHTFSVAKQVRTDTAIGASPVSVAFAAVSLARQIFSDLNGKTALLVGAGDTIELTARHLHEHHIGRLIIANRTIEKAQLLAKEFDGYAITLDQIPNHLEEADILITSTASPEPIITAGMCKAALKKRKSRPIFIVDIAVPRDVEAAAGTLQDIYLYTVDDLRTVIEEGRKSRQEAAKQAEEIIETQVQHFMGWMRSLDSVGIIRAYRQNAHQKREELLEKAIGLMKKGKSPEEALQFLSYQLTNKLIHGPTVQIRHAAFNGNEMMIRLAQRILDIPDIDDKDEQKS